MGYFLLYESMLDSVLYARDKWLAEGGLMMPDKARMYVSVIDDEAYYKKKLNYWNSVYGVSMKCMKKWVLSEPIIDPINHQDILCKEALLLELDLQTVTAKDLDFSADFTLNMEMEGGMYGLVSWFDCDFSHGSKKISLSTSPYKKQTHWKQTIFYV
jgi:protein arginine N-methyltransferase 1